MRNYKFVPLLAIFLACYPSHKNEKLTSLSDLSLPGIFEQLIDKSNPFEFYKDVFENFRFELKSTVLLGKETDDAPPLESITTFESNDQEEERFYKKSLEPISEVEWIEKQNKDFIRYDDSKHFLRTSYNPEFEKWKKGIFQDIQSVFDLQALAEEDVVTEKNQWSCYQTEQQKLCLDTKTGLPVFGKAIKKIKEGTAVSMVFTLVYGEDALPAKPPVENEAPQKGTKNQGLRKKQ